MWIWKSARHRYIVLESNAWRLFAYKLHGSVKMVDSMNYSLGHNLPRSENVLSS